MKDIETNVTRVFEDGEEYEGEGWSTKRVLTAIIAATAIFAGATAMAMKDSKPYSPPSHIYENESYSLK